MNTRRTAHSTDSEEVSLPLRIVCEDFPADSFRGFGGYEEIQLALQRTADDELEPGQPKAGARVFECEVRVRRHLKSGQPNFLGPHTHGTPEQRFVYLTWTGLMNGRREMFRRIKVHLSSITWEQIESVLARRGTVLQARVTARDRRCGPACASVPLLDGGWVVKRR